MSRKRPHEIDKSPGDKNCPPSLSQYSISDIAALVDDQVQDLSKPWRGKLMFEVTVVNHDVNINQDLIDSTEPVVVNISSYLGGEGYPAKRLYFSATEYPPPIHPTEMKGRAENNKSPGWILLKKKLCESAYDGGQIIIVDGYNSHNNGQNRRFVCENHAQHDSRYQKLIVDDKNPLRGTSLVNNRKNNRSGGKQKSKRTKQFHDHEKVCKFGFLLKWDEFGFYIELARRAGNADHEGHGQILEKQAVPVPLRFLTSQEKDNARSIMNATCNRSAGRNFLYNRFGKYLNRMKMAYVDTQRNADDGDVIPSTTKKDDILRMIDDMQNSQEVSYTCLSDVPTSDLSPELKRQRAHLADKTVTVATTKSPTGTIVEEDYTTKPMLNEIVDSVQEERNDRRLKDIDSLFIAMAWIFLPSFQFFKLCPEVIFCDVTSHLNNKGFHLFNFSCQTSIGKQVIFLWVFMPNEQRFSFRWVFQFAIPTLIPQWMRERVIFIMKDGDPQQRNEILYSMQNVFPNASEGSCGFHIGT